MKAVISFQAGVALVEDSEGVQVLSVDGAPLAPTVRAAQHLLMSATDLMEQDVESVASLQQRLEIGFACDRGLQMLLILIDAEEHLETRELAGECCEERLQSELVQDYVANRLHQQPLPEDTDLRGALELVQKHGWRLTLTLLNELDASQPMLQKLFEALEKIPDQIVEEAGWPTREYAQRQLADTGVLRKLCRSGRAGGGVAARNLLGESSDDSAGFQTFLTTWIGIVEELFADGGKVVAREVRPWHDVAACVPTNTLPSPEAVPLIAAWITDDLTTAFHRSLGSTFGKQSFPDTIQCVFQFMELSSKLQFFYLSQMPPRTEASFAKAMDFLDGHTTTPLTDTDAKQLGALLNPFFEFMSARQPMAVIDDSRLTYEMFSGKTWLELAGDSRDYLASLRGILNIINARRAPDCESPTPPQDQ